MSDYNVPRLLWESLESVLNASGRAYCRELAKILKIPEKELLRKVFPTSDTIKVVLHDTQTDTLQCQAYVPTGNVTCRCRKPVALGSTFCDAHQVTRATVVETPDTIHIHKLADDTRFGKLWTTASQDVINSSGVVVGKWSEANNKLRMFIASE